MDGNYLPALLGAGPKDVLEHALLRCKAPIEASASIEPNLADIAGVAKVSLEQCEFPLALGNELGV
jgi:hypothetical protein